jgi:hypothetical protein
MPRPWRTLDRTWPRATCTGPSREPALWLASAALLTGAAGAAFWGAGFARAGRFPVPLDDVFIHFGFARSAALGHPFAWIPGNGYSSGGTSLTYPLALAPGWLLGLRGERLALFAALIAWISVVDLARSLRALVAPRWVSWAAPALLLAVPLLDWSLFSGMETAFLAAVLGRALLAARAAERAPPSIRARAQRRAGLWAALLVATRPEAAPLAILLGLAVVHAAGSLATAPSLARALGPTGFFLAVQAAANRAFTGEMAAAGAIRKLVTENPYATSLDVAAELIKNLAALRSQAFELALGGPRIAWVVPLLGLAAALDRRSRRLAVPLLLGAAAAIFLVAFNATARFQNLRYAAPSLLMILAAALLGAGAVARRGRAGAALAGAALAVAVLAPAGAFPRQIEHFARASANIAGQQIEVARRLAARSPRPRRLLVGDAGAIPYLSGLPAIDGLGLGGYRGLPFARASVHGVPAVVELLERLPADERPDVLALYPSWWAGLADVFGRPVDRVRIEDNVICGADEKVVYEASFSALADPGEARPGAIDAVDVADLVDERAHGYVFPGPRGGWVIGRVLSLPDGRRRFDAGRIVPEGQRESFVIDPGVTASGRESFSRPSSTSASDSDPSPSLGRGWGGVPRSVLVLRTDGGGEGSLRVALERGGRVLAERDAALPARAEDRWFEVRVPLPEVRGGDRVSVFAVHGPWRSFHAWLLRE